MTNKPDTWEAELVAQDPYENATIDKEAFVKKYGKAAERFIKEIIAKDHAALKKRVEGMRKKITGHESIGTDGYLKGHNKALDKVLALYKVLALLGDTKEEV